MGKKKGILRHDQLVKGLGKVMTRGGRRETTKDDFVVRLFVFNRCLISKL